MFVRVKFSTYEEGCPICLKCCSVKKKPPSTDRRKWTPRRSDVSEKEKAHHPQWMATPQHVHLGGEGTMNGYCFLFTMSHAPTTDSHVQWLVQTTMDPRAPRGWDGMGWDGMVVGAYIGLLHL